MNGDGAISKHGGESARPLSAAESQRTTGDFLFQQGRINEAIQAYISAINADSNYSPAYASLGHTLHAVGRHEEAVVAYREGLAINPDDFELHAALAALLAKMRRLDESRAELDRAQSLNPNAAITHEAHGELMLQNKNPKAAADSFRHAVRVDPRFALAWNNLGMVLSSLGRFEEAADAFRHLIALRPDSAIAHSNLINTGYFSRDTEIQQLIQLWNKPNLPIDERIPAAFSLGKLLDSANRFDEAFYCYSQGNALTRQQKAAAGETFNPQIFGEQIDQMIEIFTPEFFAERSQWANPSELPVFIVGMPRSGTTLVHQIAAGHPSVHGAGESYDIIEIAKSFGGRDVRSVADGWQPNSIKAAADRHLQRLQSMNPSAFRVIDKMPSNVFRVPLIRLLFPNARIIQCRRDARDNCLSYYFQCFANGNVASYDLATCAHEYLATERLLNHWRNICPDKILDVQYESLVHDPEPQTRRLIEFLGLPWHPACLHFHRTDSPVQTASAWQVRQPLYQNSVGRAKHYQKHLQPLADVLDKKSAIQK